MLNGTMRMGAFGTIKHNGVRFIADGMTGDVEAMFEASRMYDSICSGA